MFGQTALPEDKIQERLPRNYWTSPPVYLEYQEVIKTVGDLGAQETVLKHQIKRATGETKEELAEKLVEVQSQLARAKAAEKFLDKHCELFKAYLFAVGKIF